MIDALLIATLASIAAPARASEECAAEWSAGFHLPGVSGSVRALATFDDDTGPALYIGGTFSTVADIQTPSIARWDGTQWNAVGGGITGGTKRVTAMRTFDDGTGPALYVGGTFTSAGGVPAANIARWDGSAWSPVGGGLTGYAHEVLTLEVFDDGTGSALYAGGRFALAGGQPALALARWNGSQWSIVGGAFSPVPVLPAIYALLVHDDGVAPALYVAGTFHTVAGNPIANIARWDGRSWSALGQGIGRHPNSSVHSLASFDDGASTGRQLYAAGAFLSASEVSALNIARWDGTKWTDVGGGLSGAEGTVWSDGAGMSMVPWQANEKSPPLLYVAGCFTRAGEVQVGSIARWDGAAWSDARLGVRGDPGGSWHDSPAWIHALLSVTVSGSGSLIAGGSFAIAGDTGAASVASWDGSQWSPLAEGQGFVGVINDMTVMNVDGSQQVVAGGNFHAAGTTPASNVARWDGSKWHDLGLGISSPEPYGDLLKVNCVAQTNEYGRDVLYVGGIFSVAGEVPALNVARWDGSDWSALGEGISGNPFSREGPGIVRALLPLNGDLYAGGHFTHAGGIPAASVARWDGLKWSPMGAGISGTVGTLAALPDDRGGYTLFSGGYFWSPTTSHLARWDGDSWTTFGDVDAQVYDSLVFDAGAGDGPALYIGGAFSFAGGVACPHVARWNGSNWSAVGSGIDGSVYELAIQESASGPTLYISGTFQSAGGHAVKNIARFEDGEWAPLDEGLTSSAEDTALFPVVDALAAVPSGPAAGLYAGGKFQLSGAMLTRSFARWISSPQAAADLDADGDVDGHDLAELLSQWSAAAYSPCPPPSPHDLNGDCVVGGQDLALLLAAWGDCS
jgi:hypothetical protein